MMRVSADEVEAFAAFLDETAADLRAQRSIVTSDFSDLRGSWSDKQYQQFERTFLSSVEQIDRFLRQADVYSEQLRIYAQRVREIEDIDYSDSYY